jgi:hypothetical protein
MDRFGPRFGYFSGYFPVTLKFFKGENQIQRSSEITRKKYVLFLLATPGTKISLFYPASFI